MYLEIKNKSNYSATNEDFKRCIQPLIDYVFNPNRIVFGYFKSTSDNFKQKRHQILDPLIDKINIVPVDEGSVGTGTFEEILKNHIVSQDYSVLILTGASGSGKTSIVNYVKNQIDDCKDDSTCVRYEICNRKKKEILYFDFLDTNTSDTLNNILLSYEFKLNGYLVIAVESCFSDQDILEKFLNHIKTTKDPYLVNLKYYINPIDFSYSIEDILAKIKLQNLTDTKQNSVLIGMLRYIRDQYPEQHKGCFTIIFDNIDKLDDEAQTEIIKNMVSLHNMVKCKLVITSRLTTFYKLNDNFSNIFSVIENAGPRPVDILYYRLQFYLNNRDTIDEIINIRSNINKTDTSRNAINKNGYVDYFDNIIIALSKYISPMDPVIGIPNEESIRINFNKGLVQKTLSAFSGLSVRRGLELSKRFVETMVYNYFDEPSANQLAASLSFTCARGIRFSDKLITNIYARYNDNRRNSWLLYRILNILNICQVNKIDTTIYQLYDVINLFDDVTEEDFILAINVLVDSHKRLAYISGFSHLNNIDRNNEKNTQKIHITNCGRDYLSFLAIDLSYIQNSFAALDWKTMGYYTEIDAVNAMLSRLNINHFHRSEAELIFNDLKEHIKLNYISNRPNVFNVSNIYERMQFIRIGLEILLYHDVFESFSFNQRKSERDRIYRIVSFLQYSEEINSFPTYRLTLSVADSFLKILKSYNRNNTSVIYDFSEIKLWRDFIYKVDLWHMAIFTTNFSNCTAILSAFDDFLDEISKKQS